MEVIHSTNIVFTSNGVRRNGDNKPSCYRKQPSPTEGKATKPPRASPKTVTTKSQVSEATPLPQVMSNSVTDDSPLVNSSPLFKPSTRAPDPFGGGPVLETPLSWKKRESPADSGIDLSPISVSPSKINPKVSYLTKKNISFPGNIFGSVN